MGTHMFLCGASVSVLGVLGSLGRIITEMVFKVEKYNALKKGDLKALVQYGKITRVTGVTADSCGGISC